MVHRESHSRRQGPGSYDTPGGRGVFGTPGARGMFGIRRLRGMFGTANPCGAFVLIGLCCLALNVGDASAQWLVPRYTISATGTWSTGGGYRLLSTTGQSVAGTVSWGKLGFWATAFSPVDLENSEHDTDSRPTFRLRGNYPNPFSSRTTLVFDLPEDSEVRVDVVDALGRTVVTYEPGRVVKGPARTVDLRVSELPSGVYMVRVRAVGATGSSGGTGTLVLRRD